MLERITAMRALARKIEDVQTDMVLSPYWKELAGDTNGSDPFSPYGRLRQAVTAIAELVAADLQEAAERRYADETNWADQRFGTDGDT